MTHVFELILVLTLLERKLCTLTHERIDSIPLKMLYHVQEEVTQCLHICQPQKTDKKGQQGHATTISPMLLLLRLSLTYSQTPISVTTKSIHNSMT